MSRLTQVVSTANLFYIYQTQVLHRCHVLSLPIRTFPWLPITLTWTSRGSSILRILVLLAVRRSSVSQRNSTFLSVNICRHYSCLYGPFCRRLWLFSFLPRSHMLQYPEHLPTVKATSHNTNSSTQADNDHSR
jgi:hypothetical protein